MTPDGPVAVSLWMLTSSLVGTWTRSLLCPHFQHSAEQLVRGQEREWMSRYNVSILDTLLNIVTVLVGGCCSGQTQCLW